jgi:hypothetical protein
MPQCFNASPRMSDVADKAYRYPLTCHPNFDLRLFFVKFFFLYFSLFTFPFPWLLY